MCSTATFSSYSSSIFIIFHVYRQSTINAQLSTQFGTPDILTHNPTPTDHVTNFSLTNTYKLTVRLKWIEEPPAELQVRAGKSVQLECDASGQPTPLISWRSLKGKPTKKERERERSLIGDASGSGNVPVVMLVLTLPTGSVIDHQLREA